MADRTLLKNQKNLPWPIHGGFFLRHRNIFLLFSLLLALVIWQAAVLIWQFPSFILPTPTGSLAAIYQTVAKTVPYSGIASIHSLKSSAD